MEVYNVYCFSCLFSMTLSCKQKKERKRQKASRLAFKMSVQHVSIAWKSGPCNKLTVTPSSTEPLD